MKIVFDGRYGEKVDGEYVHYYFNNVEMSKLIELICDSSPVGHPWGEATIKRLTPTISQSLTLISSEVGYFIQANNLNVISCWDRNRLSEIICPDDIEVPLGCVVPVETAWKVVEFFVNSGELSDCIEWISWDDIPSNASWSYDN